MPSRTLFAALAVVRTCVAPIDATTAPIELGANLPVSKVSVFSVPEIGPDTVIASATVAPFDHAAPCRVASDWSRNRFPGLTRDRRFEIRDSTRHLGVIDRQQAPDSVDRTIQSPSVYPISRVSGRYLENAKRPPAEAGSRLSQSSCQLPS